MNGMCVLQEAKLAALASKRWEHQLKEQCVQTEASEAFCSRPISAEFWSWGPMGKLPAPPIQEKEWPRLFPRSKQSALGTGSLHLLCVPAAER